MIRPIQKMVQNFFISANSVAQAAGYTALTDPSVRRRHRENAAKHTTGAGSL